MTLRVAILMCCHNRKAITLRALDKIFEAILPQSLTLAVYLVDDGSEDATGAAVAERYPQVRLITADGSLFWGGGMRAAQAAAAKDHFDAFVWLNDDTLLFPDAWQVLSDAIQSNLGRSSILVGSTVDGATGQISYSAYVRATGIINRLVKIYPDGNLQPCDTFNGNFVFIPRRVAQLIGGIDPVFVHAMGDLDFGLRAHSKGVPINLLPSPIGTCDKNLQRGGYTDPSLSLRKRWQRIQSPKGLPWRAWYTYNKRWGGILWPLLFVQPYVRVLMSGVWQFISGPARAPTAIR